MLVIFNSSVSTEAHKNGTSQQMHTHKQKEISTWKSETNGMKTIQKIKVLDFEVKK